MGEWVSERVSELASGATGGEPYIQSDFAACVLGPARAIVHNLPWDQSECGAHIHMHVGACVRDKVGAVPYMCTHGVGQTNR